MYAENCKRKIVCLLDEKEKEKRKTMSLSLYHRSAFYITSLFIFFLSFHVFSSQKWVVVLALVESPFIFIKIVLFVLLMKLFSEAVNWYNEDEIIRTGEIYIMLHGEIGYTTQRTVSNGKGGSTTQTEHHHIPFYT